MPSSGPSPAESTRFLGEEAAGLAREALDHALLSAEGSAEGFPPFAMVVQEDGSRQMTRFVGISDVEAARAAAAEASGSTALCVALAWDGYLKLEDGESEAVLVEAYELGQSAGVVLAQPYEREGDAVTPAGETLLCAEVDPLVPLTAELVRRHVEDFAAGGRRAVRDLLERAGADLAAFEADPASALPFMESMTEASRAEGLSEDERVYLHTQLVAFVAEVLVRGHGARWDVIADGDGFAYVLAVGDRFVDLFTLVHHRIDSDASVAGIIGEALDPTSA